MKPVTNTSLSGHLRLRCEMRSDGVPHISQQSFCAPISISKSHLDEGNVVLSIINPTAGFFDGDHIETHVTVAPRARLVLSTPSASRVYATRSKEAACNFQSFHIEENASLEWIPDSFIPHAGASYFQKTELRLHSSASLLYFDWIAPGRVAKGEIFAYKNLRWELDFFLGSVLVARERYDLDPGTHSIEALTAKFPAGHYVSLYAAGDFTKNWPAAELDELAGEDVYCGHGPLAGNVFVVRALCRDSLAARKFLETLRTLLYSAAFLKPPALGRIFL